MVDYPLIIFVLSGITFLIMSLIPPTIFFFLKMDFISFGYILLLIIFMYRHLY